jgi:hypothetical protein
MALYPESGYSTGLKLPAGVRIRGSIKPGYETVLTHEAVAFVADLVRTFRPIVQSNLALRALDQAKYDAGGHPGFDFRTKAIREEDWTCAAMPAAIQDRRVEITGPVDRKMVINALNSGAKVFMVGFLMLLLRNASPNLSKSQLGDAEAVHTYTSPVSPVSPVWQELRYEILHAYCCRSWS